MNIVGVIHARGGSKRIPLKNIKVLAGKPLVAYIIQAALEAKTINRVIISTDHPEIIKIAKTYGAEVPFVRPKEIAEDVPSELVTQHAVNYLEKENLGAICLSYLYYLRVVTGEGGIIITDNPRYARKCRLIRNHGESIPDDSTPVEDLVNIVGCNFRMTELTAAVGIGQLKKLAENNRVRNENARFLARELGIFEGIEIPNAVYNEENVIHILTILYHADRVGVSREKFVTALRAEGIPVGTGYARIMPDNPIFLRKLAYGRNQCPFSCPYYGQDIDYSKGLFPVARDLINNKQISFHIINRPNNLDDMKDIVKAFKKVYSNIEQLKTTGEIAAHK